VLWRLISSSWTGDVIVRQKHYNHYKKVDSEHNQEPVFSYFFWKKSENAGTNSVDNQKPSVTITAKKS
jgi:hypothetical protein